MNLFFFCVYASRREIALKRRLYEAADDLCGNGWRIDLSMVARRQASMLLEERLVDLGTHA